MNNLRKHLPKTSKKWINYQVNFQTRPCLGTVLKYHTYYRVVSFLPPSCSWNSIIFFSSWALSCAMKVFQWFQISPVPNLLSHGRSIHNRWLLSASWSNKEELLVSCSMDEILYCEFWFWDFLLWFLRMIYVSWCVKILLHIFIVFCHDFMVFGSWCYKVTHVLYTERILVGYLYKNDIYIITKKIWHWCKILNLIIYNLVNVLCTEKTSHTNII